MGHIWDQPTTLYKSPEEKKTAKEHGYIQGAYPDSVQSSLFHLLDGYLSETLYDWLMGHS